MVPYEAMTFRTLASLFFLLYGALIPVLAWDFAAANVVATVAMMASCVVIAALLRQGRGVLMNIIVAAYVLRVYLTRPYVNAFVGDLDSLQRNYIEGNNYFFNAHDASVVYLSLLSLLLAWFVGLRALRPRQDRSAVPPRICREVDEIVLKAGWPLWIAWAMLSVLNYLSPTQTWQGMATGEGVPLFALGLFSTATIDVVCLYAFMCSRQAGTGRASLILLFPVIFYAVSGTAGGSRGAMFSGVSLAFTYWLFQNFAKSLERRDLFKAVILVSLLPVLIFGSLLAQTLRPLLRSASDAEVIWDATVSGLDIADPNNPVANTFYFGLTEFLHRISSLQAQFLILNDRWIHNPWETFNPVHIFMRTINSLLPTGFKPFEGLLTINQLFDYIYFDELVHYSSTMWTVQGSLYLLVGPWLSPAVVLVAACVVGRNDKRLDSMARTSPCFAAFFVGLFLTIVENGTIEYATAANIVRPLTSFVALIALCKMLSALSPMKPGLRKPLAGSPRWS